MISIRDLRQQGFANMYLNSNRFNILHLAPRFGKIRTSWYVLKELNPDRVLICYPDNKIEASWKADFEELEYDDSKVCYTTYLSLWKHVEEKYDIIIMDEIHLCGSDKQLESAKAIIKNNPFGAILGLSGTISKETEKTLLNELNLPILANYSIEQAIEESVIVDYEIYVIKVPLDNKLRVYKGKTEKQKFDGYTHVINKMEDMGKDTFFLRLSRMRLIQNSIAKKNKTIELLKQYSEERILVFTGLKKIADNLGIPSYHSTTKDKESFAKFASGEGNQLAVVGIGSSGVTYLPLNRIIISYFSSDPQDLCQKINRATNFEYNNPDKKAHIYIISSTEETEIKWLKRALQFFSKEKIKYL